MEKIINATNDALYSYVLIILLVLGGIYFTIRTRFAQFRLLGQQFKSVMEKTDENGVSSFQALMASVLLNRKPALLAWIIPRSLKLSPAAMVSNPMLCRPLTVVSLLWGIRIL